MSPFIYICIIKHVYIDNRLCWCDSILCYQQSNLISKSTEWKGPPTLLLTHETSISPVPYRVSRRKKMQELARLFQKHEESAQRWQFKSCLSFSPTTSLNTTVLPLPIFPIVMFEVSFFNKLSPSTIWAKTQGFSELLLLEHHTPSYYKMPLTYQTASSQCCSFSIF